VPDFALMKREYYEYRDLDEDGRVSRDKLEKLGLAALADRMAL
jgi:aldehyde:ferredoxin oxidoreductase